MKKCLFIINPSAGTNTVQKKLDELIGKLVLNQIVNHVDIFYTQKKDDAYNKIIDINEKDYDFLVVVGGDGTINEVVSGVVNSKKTIPLVLLAAGTVNDFTTHLNLPKSTNKIYEMIKEFNLVKCDVGKINDSYFINVAAGGMFSNVSFNVSKEDKKKLGPLAYYINGIINLPSHLNTNIHLNITLDDQEVLEHDALMFIVTNTNRVGGFNKIAPYADIHDGLLDIMVIKKCSVTDLVSLYKDYLLKKHTNSPFLTYHQAKKIEIKCDNQQVVVDVDGEKGTSLPVIIENIEDVVTLIVP